MKAVTELYPGYKGGYGLCDYQPIIDACGDVLLQVDDSDYQGDTRALLRDAAGRYGHLQFGWGSCSGCDALQWCSTVADVQLLADAIESEVRWFDTAAEALAYFEGHDWQGDYSWRRDEQRKFVAQAVAILEQHAN